MAEIFSHPVFYHAVYPAESAWTRIKKSVFRILRKIPAVKNKIDTELNKIQASFSEDAKKRYQGKEFFHALPSKGQADTEIMKQVHEYLELGKIYHKSHHCLNF